MALVVAGAGTVAAAFVFLLANTSSYGPARALVVGPTLLLLSVLLLDRLLREESSTTRRIVFAALVLHLLAAAVYTGVITGAYGGSDTVMYDSYGAEYAERFRRLDLSVPFDVGTQFVRVLTGVVYTVTGPSLLTGTLVFSWFSFWGLYLFWRAFTIAVPYGNRLRYAVIVLLMPSLVFWPATIGKDAWMVLTLGVAAYGVARFLASEPGGVPAFVAGVTGATMVRPHVAAIAVVAAGIAVAFVPQARSSEGSGRRGLIARATFAVIVVVATGVVAGQIGEEFGVDDPLSAVGVETIMERTERQTQIGGSSFDAGPVTNPVDAPAAVVTVLFRPFPWETDNFQSFVASLEGFLLLGLLWRWRRSFRSLLPQMRRYPYLAFAAAFALAFAAAFGAIGNFGILARQRTQMLPFLFVLMSLSPGRAREGDAPVVPEREWATVAGRAGNGR